MGVCDLFRPGEIGSTRNDICANIACISNEELRVYILPFGNEQESVQEDMGQGKQRSFLRRAPHQCERINGERHTARVAAYSHDISHRRYVDVDSLYRLSACFPIFHIVLHACTLDTSRKLGSCREVEGFSKDSRSTARQGGAT